eukprot:snap_masked-scaffold_3-processed-gene-16.27-mRNA-1 protein AED:1.00 eAED:1.00 QI:0/-1/0/0/-1/1/1/0/160
MKKNEALKIIKREWSEAEEIFLVGNVYDQLYADPCLDDAAWETISSGFSLDCKQGGEMNGVYRTIEETKEYFTRMSTSGEYDLEAMYHQWLEAKMSLLPGKNKDVLLDWPIEECLEEPMVEFLEEPIVGFLEEQILDFSNKPLDLSGLADIANNCELYGK